jgi:hypothetical protein
MLDRAPSGRRGAMRFTITGDFNTFRASVTWEDGHLEGPEDVVAAIERAAREL